MGAHIGTYIILYTGKTRAYRCYRDKQPTPTTVGGVAGWLFRGVARANSGYMDVCTAVRRRRAAGRGDPVWPRARSLAGGSGDGPETMYVRERAAEKRNDSVDREPTGSRTVVITDKRAQIRELKNPEPGQGLARITANDKHRANRERRGGV